ncbi:ABC transporter ATP-binding protein [Kiloniella laminariae]|uniref:ABC transporter ATP-binding protein n=1 Tax=Kiloniella laminariae TaxID=454162 RepID=A0ABT4LNF3_9PROT|nr:ABC transporter ATP-binding protein [Kiloniella laminariae]MCZ4282668.1 ABC transporter ATP-binding protein [Kiloniella laminariae]
MTVEQIATSRSDVAGGQAAPPTTSKTPAIELKGISKSFGPVKANQDVDLKVLPGTIHGIIGENGAGKSTLMSILYGFYEADSGDIFICGKKQDIRSSKDAISAGIGMVHQHFMLVETFTVLENVMLGAEGGSLLNKSSTLARNELLRLSQEYSLAVDPDALIGELPVGLQQRVEILKALYRGAEILILDEPTGVLTPQETEQLFKILDILRSRGVSIILITHKLQEIMAITDRVSVMRAGTMVSERETKDTSKNELAELMVGRKVLLEVTKDEATPQETLLEAKEISYRDEDGILRLDNVSLTLRAGEIVGIAGVSGNGQTELLAALSGICALHQGSITIGDREITPDSPSSAKEIREFGVAHVPEDRHRMGMVTAFDAKEVAIMGYHEDSAYNGAFLMNEKAVENHCRQLMQEYDVRPEDPNLKSANFSGGNQQKLVLAREMDRAPKILLVGQPTRGVDIGAIEFIHKNLIKMRDAGSAILLVSVELEEVLSLSDRIIVMFEGRIVGEVTAKDADACQLGLLMGNAGAEEKRNSSNNTIMTGELSE